MRKGNLMEPKGITINVDCKLNVSTETAEMCLKLLELWSDENPSKRIEGELIATESGLKTRYRITDRERRNPLEEVYKNNDE